MMGRENAYPTLTNAPITEAVIDVRVSTSKPFTRELFDRLRNSFSEAFPGAEEQRQVEGHLELVADVGVRQSMSDHGVRRIVLRSEERQEAVVVSDEGFGFSKLRPYTNWESVFSSARKWWNVYAGLADVDVLNRAGLRYINHFRVPRAEIQKYLEAPLPLPAGIGTEGMQNTFSRLLLRDADSEIETAVVQMVDWDVTDASVLIDIDASLAGRFPPRDESFWDTFSKLRATKNRIFFGSITPYAQVEFNQ